MTNSTQTAAQTAMDEKISALAVMSEFVERAHDGIGRTALMKFLFFLTEVRQVPLPYSFRLYTYGPFDADVLEDLQYAEALGTIRSSIVQYSGGKGYSLHVGPEAARIKALANDFVEKHTDSIDWVLNQFGGRSASELEMASTLVYVDRELSGAGKAAKLGELATRVHEIKPHLSITAIEAEAKRLKANGLINADAS